MDLTRAEELRHLVLEILCAVHPAALRTTSIARRLHAMFGAPVEPQDVQSALQYLLDRQYVSYQWDTLGSSRYYRATASGLDLAAGKPAQGN